MSASTRTVFISGVSVCPSLLGATSWSEQVTSDRFVSLSARHVAARTRRIVPRGIPRIHMCDVESKKQSRLKRWMVNRKALAGRLREYGIAAVISYGIFDAITYAISLALAIQGYVAAGKVLTLRAAPQVFLAMWGINNFSRPLRVSGALAIAPFINRRVVEPIREWIQRKRAN